MSVTTKPLAPITRVEDHPLVRQAVAAGAPGWERLRAAEAELKAIDARLSALQAAAAESSPAPAARTPAAIAADLVAVFTGGRPAPTSALGAMLARRADISVQLESARAVAAEYERDVIEPARAAAVRELTAPAFRDHWRPAVRAAAELRLAHLKRLAPCFAVAAELNAAGLWGGPNMWPLPGQRHLTSAAACEQAFKNEAAALVAAGFFAASEPAVTW